MSLMLLHLTFCDEESSTLTSSIVVFSEIIGTLCYTHRIISHDPQKKDWKYHDADHTCKARKYFPYHLSKGDLSQLFYISVFVYERLTRQKTTEFKVLYTLAQTIYLVFSSVQVTEDFFFVQRLLLWLIQTSPKLCRETKEFASQKIYFKKMCSCYGEKIWFLSSSMHFNSYSIIVNKASPFGWNG